MPNAASGPEISNPIKAFFDNYPAFRYDGAKETMPQFRELCDQYGWRRNSQEGKEALNQIRNAIALQFNAIYGSDANSLNGWHNLFRALQTPEIPETVQDCKERIKTIHVNICDLVDHFEDSKPRQFPSAAILAEYSRTSEKIFPRENAYAGGLLKYLLREFFSRYKGRRGRGGTKRSKSRREG
ncbi:hypothetical protein C8R42DRAFT_568844 [Lentinula raphanica]|nr:hypothetical protein C8R42DRAFT_568844 [Lentinula raphanica]